MTKVKGPLFSVTAHGSLAGAVSFRRGATGAVVEKRPIPSDRRSSPQDSQRTSFTSAVVWWHSLEPAVKEEYEERASASPMTGYNLFIKEALIGILPVEPTICPDSIGMVGFADSDWDSEGNLYVAKNYKLYKSINNGEDLAEIFSVEKPADIWPVVEDHARCCFVDSRDRVFVGFGGTNRVWRGLKGGVDFAEVLNFNRPNNDAVAQSMCEDNLGDLYVAEYGNLSNARLWKSVNEGATFPLLKQWKARHVHYINFNPVTNWLYAVVGEGWIDVPEEDRVDGSSTYRSKDYGTSWVKIQQGDYDSPYEGLMLTIGFVNVKLVLGEEDAGAGYPANVQMAVDDGGAGLLDWGVVWWCPQAQEIPWDVTRMGSWLLVETVLHVGTKARVMATQDGENFTELFNETVAFGDAYYGWLSHHPDRGKLCFSCIGRSNSHCISNGDLEDL